jgi:hypothetical protein
MKKKYFIASLFITLVMTTSTTKLYGQNQTEVFPKIRVAVAIVHPLVTFNSERTTFNFKDYYVVGMPIAINVWKTKKIGFSFEIVPSIRSDNQISKVNNLLFHPGVLVRLKNEFTFAGRLAFETSGRYGFTPIISKAFGIHENYNYNIAIPLLVRFGNDHPASVTPGLLLGISF